MNQNKKAKVILGAILVTMLILTGGQSAHATPMLRLSDGTTTVNVTDNGVGDSSSALGVVTYSGSVGVFNVNVATGLTDPALGSTLFPEIHLSDAA